MASLTTHLPAPDLATPHRGLAIGRPLHAAAAASLFVSLAALSLGIVSFWRPIYLPQTHFRNESQAYICRNGYVTLFLTDRHPALPSLPNRLIAHNHIVVATVRASDASRRLLAFSVWLWPIAALFGIAPALRGREILRAQRTRRRAAKGLCTQCGYDLRASPAGCPECGRGGGARSAIGSSAKDSDL